MKHIIYDIETGPLSPEKLELVKPEFTAPSNYKKPEAIEAAIAKKEEEWVEKAALDATTGQVLAIGYLIDGQLQVDCINDQEGVKEKDILELFWKRTTQDGWMRSIIGWNSNAFDLPFLVRRSWVNRVDIPKTLKKGRYFDSNCIDLIDVWGDRVKLDTVAKTFGLEGKNGDGKYFSQILKEDRDKALDYLRNDIRVTAQIAQIMGFNVDLNEEGVGA